MSLFAMKLAIFEILDVFTFFEAGSGAMDTKNEVRMANWLFFKNFCW